MINKKDILNITHYGLNIYSYVLQLYYPGETVLSLSGRDCKLTKNPFNENKLSLKISIKDNCAVHSDIDNSITAGNAFDFANLHFKKNEQDLLNTLNDVLNLNIENKEKKSVFNSVDNIQNKFLLPEINIPVFSFFKRPVSNIYPCKVISLLDLYNIVRSDNYALNTNKLRNISDVKDARFFKANNFDYVTFSGTFSKRNDKALLSHSGLLTIDFDHLDNIKDIKNLLLNDEYFDTELMFVSPSGNGLKWIIPIDLSEVNHQNYFLAVSNYIKHTYNLEVDKSGKDISRACFLPYDNNAFINPNYCKNEK